MSYFVVNSCGLRACLNWRMGDTCAKNNMLISSQIAYLANMHDAQVCEVRKQLDQYRLEQMLEKT